MLGHLSTMPDIREKSTAQRKPHERQEGVYILSREAWDTEITWREPNGDTYLLSWFDAKMLMKTIFWPSGEFYRRVQDVLWNFHNVAVNWDTEQVVSLRSEPDGWEEEISLQWPWEDE